MKLKPEAVVVVSFGTKFRVRSNAVEMAKKTFEKQDLLSKRDFFCFSLSVPASPSFCYEETLLALGTERKPKTKPFSRGRLPGYS